MAATAILDFQICAILMADGVWRAQMHNYIKFHRFRYGDIAIFRIFNMSAVRHLGFIWAYLDHPQ